MFKNLFSKAALPDYENFARAVGQQFTSPLQKYHPKVDGIGHGYHFNNFILVTVMDPCMIRFVFDRNDVFIEVAPLKSPLITRRTNTKNLWTDVSVVTSWLDDEGEIFKWFYNYEENKKIETQLARLDLQLRPYWDGIVGLYAENGFFTRRQDEFLEFRRLRAQKSWKELGWNSVKNPTKAHKSVIGHFPQYAELATDFGKSSSYFGIETKVWKTLWATGCESTFWQINKQFLNNTIDKQQDELVLATEARNPKSFFSREIKYLVTKLGI